MRYNTNMETGNRQKSIDAARQDTNYAMYSKLTKVILMLELCN